MADACDPIRDKRESYYGTYAGTVTKQGSIAHESRRVRPDMLGGAKKAAGGDLVGGAKTAVGIRSKEQPTGTKHAFTLKVDESKVVATLDGKELSNCDYSINNWGKGSYRITAGDMDFSAVILKATPDDTKAQVLFIDLSSGAADGGEITRTGD